MYAEFKLALKNIIRSFDTESDVLFERLEKSDFDNDALDITSFFYVEIKPLSKRTLSKSIYQDTVLVDIIFENPTKSKAMYYDVADKLDACLRPCFAYGDTDYALVNEAHINIVDDALHYTFTVDVVYTVINKTNSELMAELDVTIERSN